jgi:hypothetical protein
LRISTFANAFKGFYGVVCSCIGKLSASGLSKEIYKKAISFLAIMSLPEPGSS